MCTVYFWFISKLVNANIIGNMPRGDHCAVWGCDNDKRYPERQKILPHIGVLRFHSPKNKKDALSWATAINRVQFKVTMRMKVCSNHFARGYRTAECPTPTLYMKGYDCESESKRLPPRIRTTQIKERQSRKRKRSSDENEVVVENEPLLEDDSILQESTDFDYAASASPADTDPSFLVNAATQTESTSQVKEERKYFIDQATCPKNCYRYTGVTRSTLDLVFEILEPKATKIRL